jgi:hypothetical protein
MNTKALKIVRHLFCSEHVPREHNRSYQRQWVRQVRLLGDKWLLAKHVNKGGSHASV